MLNSLLLYIASCYKQMVYTSGSHMYLRISVCSQCICTVLYLYNYCKAIMAILTEHEITVGHQTFYEHFLGLTCTNPDLIWQMSEAKYDATVNISTNVWSFLVNVRTNFILCWHVSEHISVLISSSVINDMHMVVPYHMHMVYKIYHTRMVRTICVRILYHTHMA